MAVAALAFVLVTGGRELPLPSVVGDLLERRMEAALDSAVDLGRLAIVAEGGGRLRLRGEEVRLSGAEGDAGVVLPALEAALAPGALEGPPRAPRRLTVEGAELRVTRRPDGALDFGIGAIRLVRRSPAEAIARLQRVLARPALSTLEHVDLTRLDLTVHDRRSGATYRLRDARLTLERAGGTLSLALVAEMPGRVALRLTVPEEGPAAARLSALVDGVEAAALAAQAPALGWLAPLDAPVSGALIGRLAPGGGLGPVDGTLEIGAGRVAPAGAAPLPLDRARAYFSYRPETRRLTFDELAVEAPALSLAGSGHAYLDGMDTGWPTGLTAQLRLSEGRLAPAGGLPAPVALTGGSADARITLDPFVARIGQAALEFGGGTGDVRVSGRGRVSAAADGWTTELDLSTSDVAAARILSLWPEGAARGTRRWLARNLKDGRVRDAAAGLRLAPERRPDLAVTFDFADAEVQALRGLPRIEGGVGRATLAEDAFTLTLEEGRATPPDGGPIDLSGSTFRVADTRRKPAEAVLHLETRSTITDALSLLDQPPLGLMSKVGLPVALSEGTADLSGEVRFPVGRRVTPDQIRFDVSGRLTDVRSERLVPGRTLSADRLELAAASPRLAVSGAARLDGVPLTATFRQPLGPERRPATVEGRVTLSPGAAESFGVSLPPGALSGAGRAEVTLLLPPGAAPELSLSSDLVGLGLRLPGLGWSKPAGAAGKLELAGRLGHDGRPPRFDTFALEAPGLVAAGRLTLAEGGGLGRLTLDTARLGGWFDGAIALVGRGPGGPPAVEMSGGTLDLPGARFGGGSGGSGGSGGGGGGQGPPIGGRLDRLRIAGDVALTDVRADLVAGGGLSGEVRARVNGGPPVSGTLSATATGRPAIRFRADDAGAVLAAAGAFDGARGGTLDLTLAPDPEEGRWQGALDVSSLRVTSAPGLAALLNTISVVGLLDQLQGPGLLFSTVRADFRLTPGGIVLEAASAVGPSLGVSADGVYDTRRGEIDLQGVLSPVFAVNAIGQLFSREGEGLFGFNYRVRGPVDDPEIRVNPLSMLAPGAFRQIFRTAPPRLPGAAQDSEDE